ncbi:MAG: glycosyltransferase family 4 protein, partial [Planctomycetota bacterium]
MKPVVLQDKVSKRGGLKILVVSNLFPPAALGGYERRCSLVCQGLLARGHEVHVLTTPPPAEFGTLEEEFPHVERSLSLFLPFDRPVRGAKRWRRWRRTRRNHRRMRAVLQHWKPDVVFVWSQLRLSLGAARAAQEAGIPMLYSFGDEHLASYRPVPFQLAPKRLAGFLADRFLFPSGTLRGLRFENALFISQRNHDRLKEAGIEFSHSKILHRAIDIRAFPLKPRPGEIRKPARILFLGQLHDYKGAHTVLEAAGILEREHGPGLIEVTLVGKGDAEYRERLETLAESLSSPVTFRGGVPHFQVAAIFREHDIYVFPSIYPEAFGGVLLEAMASGTVVVATAHGGAGEFLV